MIKNAYRIKGDGDEIRENLGRFLSFIDDYMDDDTEYEAEVRNYISSCDICDVSQGRKVTIVIREINGNH